MRAGPSAGDLRPSRFRHDIRAKGRLLYRAAGKCEAHSGPKQNSAFHVVARLMKLPNEPVQLRLNSQEDFPHNVDYLAMFGVNGAPSARAGSEEKLAVLGREDEAYRDALFRCGYR